MKKTIILFLFITTFKSNAQDNSPSVEKSIFNIETGFLGVWVNNESKLSNSVAVRTELGLESGLFWKQDQKTGFVMAPSIRVEPRWYYNLNKRSNVGKKIENNSANFLTASLNYLPDWFVISNYDNANVVEQFSIIPKWGLRRTLGNSNFTFEFSTGLGYKMVFYKNKTDKGVVLDLNARIGYSF